MRVDGRAIASDIYKELALEIKESSIPPTLTVFCCAPNFETKKYLALKMKKAEEVGILIGLVEWPLSITQKEAVEAVYNASTDGVLVQLPLPDHLDTSLLLEAIPKDKDVDGMNYEAGVDFILPPVVGAIAEIAARHQIDFASKKVAVIGQGKLVGRPASQWAKSLGAEVRIYTKETPVSEWADLKNADIIITGVGVESIVIPKDLKEGVVIFDAGTSESGGFLVGDVAPECEEKASLITPVPGGIGPVTIAILLQNTMHLAKKNRAK